MADRDYERAKGGVGHSIGESAQRGVADRERAREEYQRRFAPGPAHSYRAPVEAPTTSSSSWSETRRSVAIAERSSSGAGAGASGFWPMAAIVAAAVLVPWLLVALAVQYALVWLGVSTKLATTIGLWTLPTVVAGTVGFITTRGCYRLGRRIYFAWTEWRIDYPRQARAVHHVAAFVMIYGALAFALRRGFAGVGMSYWGLGGLALIAASIQAAAVALWQERRQR